MQSENTGPSPASARRVMLVLMSPAMLYNYLYSMSLSGAYGLAPILGGALYMSGAVATAYMQTFVGANRRCLTRRMRVAGTVLLLWLLLFSLVVFSIYPVFSAPPSVWALFAVVLALTLRGTLGRRLVASVMLGRVSRLLFILLYAALQLLPACVLLPVFFSSLPRVVAWQTLGGYGLSVLLEGYGLLRERAEIAAEHAPCDVDAQAVRDMASDLRSVHAYGAYQRLHLLIIMALQVTLVMVYTFIGITTGEIITCLALSAGCTIFSREATDLLLRRLKPRAPALLPLLLGGLILWAYALVLFYRQLGGAHSLAFSYLTLALSSAGLSVSVTCLAQLEREMAEVAEYGLHSPAPGYGRVRAVYTEFAILLGQMVAMALLAFLCMPAGLDLASIDLAFVARSFRPLMVAPPLLLLVSAIVSALHFPLNNRHFEKLRRFLSPGGASNPALKKQLDAVVVARHKNRFGLRLLMLLIRPLYYHRLLGRENAAGLEDGTLVLVCNHGELYGPIVANLYIPISFRPWSINKMMEPEAIVRHIYENTALRQTWLPGSLKLPLTRLISPLCLWAFKSLEAIPVYRDDPRRLVQTFRQTVEAMQAGDNILLFPEHDRPEAPGQRGYAPEGVGELYTGFAMIAPAYYAKTHRRAVFLPIYASRQLRTLTIGEGVRYDPEAPATQEKLRIVHTLLGRMEALYAVEQAETARRRQARVLALQKRRRLRPAQRAELAALLAEAAEAAPETEHGGEHTAVAESAPASDAAAAGASLSAGEASQMGNSPVGMPPSAGAAAPASARSPEGAALPVGTASPAGAATARQA